MFKKCCQESFENFQNLVRRYFPQLKPFMEEILLHLKKFFKTENETLVKIIQNTMKNIIIQNGGSFNQEEWTNIIKILESVLEQSTPYKLIDKKNLENNYLSENNQFMISKSNNNNKNQLDLEFSVQECVVQCLAQLLLIDLIKDLILKYHSKINFENLKRLESQMKFCFELARSFNEQIYLRHCIQMKGFMFDMDYLPGLLKQEKQSLECLLEIQFFCFLKQSPNRKEHLNHFIDESLGVFEFYFRKHSELIEVTQRKKLAQEQNLQLKESKIALLRKQKTSFFNEKSIFRKSLSFQDNQVEDIQDHSESFIQKNLFEMEIEKLIQELTPLELERELINYKQVIKSTILPKLSRIPPGEVEHLDKLCMMLIQVQGFSFSYNFSCILCNNCKDCTNCNITLQRDFRSDISEILQSYFSFIYERSQGLFQAHNEQQILKSH